MIRWGDPLFADAPEFDPLQPERRGAGQQFGYNYDYLDIIATDRAGHRALLVAQPRVHQREHHVPADDRPGEPPSSSGSRWPRTACPSSSCARRRRGDAVGVRPRGAAATAGSPSTPRSPSTAPPPGTACSDRGRPAGRRVPRHA